MLARGEAAPLRFLIAVVLLWVAIRGAILAGWNPFVAQRGRLGPPPGWLMLAWPAPETALRSPAVAHVATDVRNIVVELLRRRVTALGQRAAVPTGPIRAGIAMSPDMLHLLSVAAFRPSGPRSYARAPGTGHAAAIAGSPRTVATPLPRWSGSAWAFVRGGGHARPLSPDGRIGAGQAGARILYRLDGDGRLAAAARLSRTIGGQRQAEAAIGLDWRPLSSLPVHVMAERRIAIDRGGRDAFALGVAGGVYAVPLADGWRLDGYGEAGVVGARRRDLYADGAVRAGRVVAVGDGDTTLTIGVGLWGAAQPHAARLDAGPSAVLRLPVAARTVALALDYRARLVGDARPHSGVALTLGVDF